MCVPRTDIDRLSGLSETFAAHRLLGILIFPSCRSCPGRPAGWVARLHNATRRNTQLSCVRGKQESQRRFAHACLSRSSRPARRHVRTCVRADGDATGVTCRGKYARTAGRACRLVRARAPVAHRIHCSCNSCVDRLLSFGT